MDSSNHTTFPEKWDDLFEMEVPIDFPAFLDSNLLTQERYRLQSMSTANRTSGCISLIASICLIVHILRSYNALSTTYHRVVLGLSIGDIMSSLAFALNSLMVPKENNYYIPGANGNLATCTLQGFFFSVGIMTSTFYNCSICFYYFAIIKCSKSDGFIRDKLEPWFHAFPIFIPLTVGCTAVALKEYNALGNLCYAAPHKPPHCIGYDNGHIQEEGGFRIPCGRGRDIASSSVFNFTAMVSFLLQPIVIGTTMTIMFRTVARIERRSQRYGIGALRLSRSHEDPIVEDSAGNEQHLVRRIILRFKMIIKRFVKRLVCRSDDDRERGSITAITRRASPLSHKRAVLYMASGYAAAWAVVWVPMIANVIVKENSEVDITLSLLMPLQGLFNFIVFMSPKVRSAKKQRRRGQPELSWYNAFITAYVSRGERRRAAEVPAALSVDAASGN